MSDKEQKLVGYIVYDIWTYRTKSPQDENYKHQVIIPKVHWKKKIYTSLSSAEEAARHLEGENRLAKAIIVPIYANREDLDWCNNWLKENLHANMNNEETYSIPIYENGIKTEWTIDGIIGDEKYLQLIESTPERKLPDMVNVNLKNK
jgi:hypothetical protein